MAKQTNPKSISHGEMAAPDPSVTYTVAPHVARMCDADNKVTEVQTGWMLVREAGDQKEYCGEGLNWRPRPVIGIPFESREIAERQMEFYARQDAARASVIPIQTLISEIPYCDIPQGGHGAGAFMLRLSPEELWMVQAIRTALQRMNQERPGGQRIESDSESIRWLLRALVSVVHPAPVASP